MDKCPRVTFDSINGPGALLAKNVLSKALALVPRGQGAICILEAGTVDGTGSSKALVFVLHKKCLSEGRSVCSEGKQRRGFLLQHFYCNTLEQKWVSNV